MLVGVQDDNAVMLAATREYEKVLHVLLQIQLRDTTQGYNLLLHFSVYAKTFANATHIGIPTDVVVATHTNADAKPIGSKMIVVLLAPPQHYHIEPQIQ